MSTNKEARGPATNRPTDPKGKPIKPKEGNTRGFVGAAGGRPAHQGSAAVKTKGAGALATPEIRPKHNETVSAPTPEIGPKHPETTSAPTPEIGPKHPETTGAPPPEIRPMQNETLSMPTPETQQKHVGNLSAAGLASR